MNFPNICTEVNGARNKLHKYRIELVDIVSNQKEIKF